MMIGKTIILYHEETKVMNILKNPELYLINLFDELQLYGETD